MTTTPISSMVEDLTTPRSLIPVSIITGFLGSGKTTLLNHILQNQQGIKTAVFVNEFGEMGIDNELIISTSDDQNMVELSNGCICCNINNDLVQAIYRVLARDEPVDYIIIETSGISNPLPIALSFLGTELRDLTRLDSIITLVDAANFSIDLFNTEAAESQIAYADIILLNKTDLVDEADVDLLEVRLRDMRKDARILRTVKSAIAIPLILSVGLFESDKYLENNAEIEDHSDCDHEHGHCTHEHHDHDHSNCDHEHGHCTHEHHDHQHSHHLDNDGFVSLSFTSDRPFSLKKFHYFLENQLPTNLFRAKGFLWIDEAKEERHIFHLCGKRYSFDAEDWKGQPKTQLVLIGQNLDREKLQQQLERCLCIPSDRGKGFG